MRRDEPIEYPISIEAVVRRMRVGAVLKVGFTMNAQECQVVLDALENGEWRKRWEEVDAANQALRVELSRVYAMVHTCPHCHQSVLQCQECDVKVEMQGTPSPSPLPEGEEMQGGHSIGYYDPQAGRTEWEE